MGSSVLLCPVLSVCLLLVSGGLCTETIVSTTPGAIRGHVLDVSGHNVVGSEVDAIHMFLGIPYAEPPVGDLRLARTLEKKAWSPRTLDALSFSPACPQPDWFLKAYSFPANFSNYDEDCLYLNIYAPQIIGDPNATYPVLFWIHGGAYRYGSGAEYDGRVLAQEGVVVVTINYRLGVLGFLSTDDDVAPGNYGLLDQLTALKWVKDNIAGFHGDPDRITIFGQSAGGGSVSLHMFSKLAHGLFNSMIPQSGCALSPWAIYRPPHTPATYARALGEQYNCPVNSSADLIQCLRTIDAHAFGAASVSGPPMIATFAPRVDGYYITDLPEVLLQRGDYIKHVNVMTGYVPQELSEDLENEPDIDNGLSKSHLLSLFRSKSSRYLDNADDMLNAMTCAYPPSDGDVELNRDYAINMNSDYGYVVPHIKLSEELSGQGERVWLYDFTYRSPNSLKKPWIGVPHAEELYFQFGAPFMEETPCPDSRAVTCPVTWGQYQPWTEIDRNVSLAIMRLWADFARMHHNAKIFPSSTDNTTWPLYSPDQSLLNISTTVLTSHVVQTQGQRFWASFNYLDLSVPVPDVCDKDAGVLVG